jgi:hypothetical protein
MLHLLYLLQEANNVNFENYIRWSECRISYNFCLATIMNNVKLKKFYSLTLPLIGFINPMRGKVTPKIERSQNCKVRR